jgi:hypothetical protein
MKEGEEADREERETERDDIITNVSPVRFTVGR